MYPLALSVSVPPGSVSQCTPWLCQSMYPLPPQVGRLLIRAALSLLLGLSNNDIQVTRSEKGKPLLIRDGHIDSRVGFNVSHQVFVI